MMHFQDYHQKTSNTLVLEDPQTGKLLERNVHIKKCSFPYVLQENDTTSRDEVDS